MTTSLASQLASLASRNASRVDTSSSLRAHASYLFTPRVAAEQDYATVHALGVTGWEQLVNDDAALAEWRHADLLFGEESVRMDRATLPASENELLDTACDELLYLLGPTLLSRSAAKCLEWLVRRFAIQEHVPVAIVRAFFPYHTTPQFARMLQLLPVERVPVLHFLQAVKKAQSPLPTSVLLQAMSTNADLLRLVAKTRTPLEHVHRLPITFWTATLVQFCLQHASRRSRKSSGRDANEAQTTLAVLLPEILRLLRTPADTEAGVGALMVLCSLSTAYALSVDAVRGVLEGVAQLATSRPLPAPLARAVVACCFTLCASPEEVRDPLDAATPASQRLLTDATVQALLQLPELGAQVERALREHDVRRFLAQLLAALVDRVQDDAGRALLETLLDHTSVPAELVQATCTRLILHDENALWDARVEMLAAQRQRRPDVLDAALDVVRVSDEKRAWALLSAILHHQATGSVPAPQTTSSETALWLGVQSTDATQRLLTLQELFAAVQSGTVRGEDALVRDAVLATLADPTVPLLEAMYAQSQLVLTALPPRELLHAIRARLEQEMSVKEYKLHVRFSVQTLGHADHTLGQAIWEAVVWPYLLPFRGTKRAVAAVEALQHAPADGALHVYAQRVGQLTPSGNRAAYVRALIDALVPPKKHAEAHVAFLLETAKARPVSQPGVTALAVLLRTLATVPEVAATLVPYHVMALVREQQYLWGDADEFVPDEKDDAGVVLPALDQLTRQNVRMIGMQLLFTTLRHMAQPASPAVFLDVQQRATVASQLQCYAFQTLHAPGVSAGIRAKLLTALYQQWAHRLPATLAGLWAMEWTPEPSAATAALTRPFVPSCHVAERLVAVRHALVFVAEAEATSTALDWQMLLPSILLLLQETAPVLRDAGAQLIRALAALHQAVPLPAKTVYAQDTLYGASTEHVQYLDGRTCMEYVALLAEDATSFVNDTESLATTHARILAGTKKDRVVFRRRILAYLLSHAVSWPSQMARTSLLQSVHRVAAPYKLQTVTPLVQEAVVSEGSGQAYLDLLFGTYDASATAVDQTQWAAFVKALKSNASTGLPSAALRALQHGFFDALPTERREAVFLALAETLADPRVENAPEAATCLRTLPFSDGVLVSVLRTLLQTLGDEERQQKRARSDDASVRTAAVVLITVLESVQSRTLGMRAGLVSALFDVVRAAISLHGSVLFNAEYVLQLAMQSLCAMFDNATSLPADVIKVVRADTIVRAIKISSNTQSINHAILLLTRFAHLDPELVLHNIMPIFTFVGLSVLQRDDRFTLSVVEQTLRSIIPAFVNAIRPQVVHAQDARFALWLETRSLLRIFSDAASHIPRHRRQVFFRLLVDVLGAADFLAPVTMLLADRSAHRVSKAPQNGESLLHLPLGVLRAEPAAVRVHALNQIWPEITRLYAGTPTFLEGPAKRAYSQEHLAPARQAHTLLVLVLHALPARVEDRAPVDEMETCAWNAVGLQPTDAAGQATLDEVRVKVVRLLPTASFVQLVHQLLSGAASALPAPVAATERPAMGLAFLAARPLLGDAAKGEESALLNQALLQVWSAHADDLGAQALAALHARVAEARADEAPALATLLPPLLQAASTPPVLALLAQLVAHLGVRALAQLTTLVQTAYDAAQKDEGADVAAGLALLASLFRSLPQFMHAYVERAVRVLSAPKVHALMRSRAASVRATHRTLQDVVVKRMPFANLLEALVSAWQESYDPVLLLPLLQQGVKAMDKAAVLTHYKAVFRFLLTAFALQEGAGSAAALLPAVDRSMQVYVALSLKLSETQFRPLFLRTYDWAAVDLLEEGEAEAGTVYARSLVLYTLLGRLLEELRGMVTSYFAVAYDHCLGLLDECAQAGSAPTPLWYALLASVQQCAEVDEGAFWNAARATKLVSPLVAQLPGLGAEDTAAVKALTKVALAVAETVPDDAYLRTLNAALMAQASNASLTLRMHALEIAASLWAAHGVNLLAFVPETVTQLTELLDDVDPRAAHAALRLRREIEAALGEPLDSYLE